MDMAAPGNESAISSRLMAKATRNDQSSQGNTSRNFTGKIGAFNPTQSFEWVWPLNFFHIIHGNALAN
jgi:hypothetical protein